MGKVVLRKRGESEVSFYLTQWMSMEDSFDESETYDFDRFIQAFKVPQGIFISTTEMDLRSSL